MLRLAPHLMAPASASSSPSRTLSEGGFAAAVGADDADAFAALHVELQIVPELLAVEALGKLADLEQLVAGPLVGVDATG